MSRLRSRSSLFAAPALPPVGVPLRAPTHPGRLLARTCLRPLSLNQSEAARLLGTNKDAIQDDRFAAIDALVERIAEGNYESVAIGFIHSYVNGAHERQLRDAVRNGGTNAECQVRRKDGKPLFAGVQRRRSLELVKAEPIASGKVVLTYRA